MTVSCGIIIRTAWRY